MKKNIIYLSILIIITCGSLLFYKFRENDKLKMNINKINVHFSNKEANNSEKQNYYASTTKNNTPLADNSSITKSNANDINSLIADIEDSFSSKNMKELNRAASKISEYGEEAIYDLLKIIEDKSKDPALRRMAFELVRDIGVVPKFTNTFIKIAEDSTEDSLIRGDAVWTLGLTGSDEAIDSLLRFLRDKGCDNRIRKLSATSLGLLKASEAKAILIETIRDTDTNTKIRAASVEAIGQIKGQNSFDVLADSVKSQSWEIQISASKALSSYGNSSSAQVLHDQLLNEMSNSEKTHDAVIKSIIESLGSIGSKESIPVLLSVLKGDDQYFSALAGKSLGEIGTPQVLPDIEQVLINATDPFQIKLLNNACLKLDKE